MRIAGVIAEYNPFHSGHQWHLAETRRQSGCDWVVICMTGSYTQRGEAACFSKWARARMALRCGADAVVELPALFAVRTADVFASAGVSILGGLGVDCLSFGTELADLATLNRLAALRTEEPPAFSARVQTLLSDGMTHARAWGSAASEALGLSQQALNAPNTALAIEYVRAAALWPRMDILPVPRLGQYHAVSLQETGFASATAIRHALQSGDAAHALAQLPERIRSLAADPEPMHSPDDLLLARLRSLSAEALAELPDVNEGLEHRVLAAAARAEGRQALIEAVKCRRYTYARLSRLCAHALLEVDTALIRRHPVPTYARLLGFRAGAEPLLRVLKQRSRLSLVADPLALRDDEVFAVDCRATDLRALQCDRPDHRCAGQEFTAPFVRVSAEEQQEG